MERQKAETKVKIIEIQEQQLQNRLNDLRADIEERLSITTIPGISIDARHEQQVLVVIYACDNLGNNVPVDSYWANSSDFSLSSLELEMLTNFETVDSLIPHLLKLLFGMFQIVFGIWLLCLAFGF